jgi:hypothetical protein
VKVLLGLVVEHVGQAPVDARDAGGQNTSVQDAPRGRRVCKADRPG